MGNVKSLSEKIKIAIQRTQCLALVVHLLIGKSSFILETTIVIIAIEIKKNIEFFAI